MGKLLLLKFSQLPLWIHTVNFVIAAYSSNLVFQSDIIDKFSLFQCWAKFALLLIQLYIRGGQLIFPSDHMRNGLMWRAAVNALPPTLTLCRHPVRCWCCLCQCHPSMPLYQHSAPASTSFPMLLMPPLHLCRCTTTPPSLNPPRYRLDVACRP